MSHSAKKTPRALPALKNTTNADGDRNSSSSETSPPKSNGTKKHNSMPSRKGQTTTKPKSRTLSSRSLCLSPSGKHLVIPLPEPSSEETSASNSFDSSSSASSSSSSSQNKTQESGDLELQIPQPNVSRNSAQIILQDILSKSQQFPILEKGEDDSLSDDVFKNIDLSPPGTLALGPNPNGWTEDAKTVLLLWYKRLNDLSKVLQNSKAGRNSKFVRAVSGLFLGSSALTSIGFGSFQQTIAPYVSLSTGILSALAGFLLSVESALDWRGKAERQEQGLQKVSRLMNKIVGIFSQDPALRPHAEVFISNISNSYSRLIATMPFVIDHLPSLKEDQVHRLMNLRNTESPTPFKHSTPFLTPSSATARPTRVTPRKKLHKIKSAKQVKKNKKRGSPSADNTAKRIRKSSTLKNLFGVFSNSNAVESPKELTQIQIHNQ